MMRTFQILALILAGSALQLAAAPVFYPGTKSIAKNKHLVLIGSDHEYRSEETIPALARILAKHHGFDCTVLLGVDPKSGEVVAGVSNVPGMEALAKADGLIIFARFLQLPDDQMKHLDDYLNRGGPVMGLRTSTHAFNYKKDANSPYKKYHFKYNGDDYKGGFGHQVLGQTWVGHYGGNHSQCTVIDVIPEKADHPILRGVKNAWVHAGGYNAVPQDDWEALTMAQPMNGMKPTDEADAKKPPKVSEWTRHYTAANGTKARVFTSLYGASEDLLNDGYRRMLVNAAYWLVGLEDQIKADAPIDFVGPYRPNLFCFGGHAQGVKPEVAYAGFESPVPANNDCQGRRPKRQASTVESVREATAALAAARAQK